MPNKNNKDGFFGDILIGHTATGITQQTTAGASTAVKVDSTTTGGIGSTAFTVADIVAALKKVGILAQ